ncbi:hypothetical protein DW322_07435 [Rhodococcus rhodnii]|uniref:Uncharacterized protein n=2 Tax=Rhodococcus rhodnii TaxID=38312 RepID=R7WN56_9NOCA|nr:hypothetical protein [Rhodococcus rhodnii]EOM76732.1 hypothetical protein Rrhod_1851 [Rhodococcus rhodnii LMG 5362]TXG90077.1 hypothetical protein DW322_07435 [Rhodococcus rhodnii]
MDSAHGGAHRRRRDRKHLGRAKWENGNYGYPITDEFDIPGGRRQIFQGGPIDYYWDKRPVGKIKMSTFRWQNFIPEKQLAVRCDYRHSTDDNIISERYAGDNRSWNPEGGYGERQDLEVYVDQSRSGAKTARAKVDVGTTHQYLEFIGYERDDSRRASTENLNIKMSSKKNGDWPDVIRLSVDSLSTQPFCDAPVLRDGILAHWKSSTPPPPLGVTAHLYDAHNLRG